MPTKFADRNLENSLFKRLLWSLMLFTLITLLPNTGVASEPLGCIIEPERTSNVGSPIVGIIDSVKVERGDHVRKGQILATLQSSIQRASVEIAKTRSKAIADVRAAQESLNLAQMTEARAVGLVKKKFISKQALDKTHAETAISSQKLALVKEQLNTSDKELSFARAQLNERTIRSPIDGIIADRFVWSGERVEDKPLFRVVSINPLRVEMVAPATLYGQITKGMSLTITPQLPNTAPVQATVVLVDQLVDGPSNTFRIRAEIPNDDFSLPSGLRCKASLPEADTSNTAQSTTNKTTLTSHKQSSEAKIRHLKFDRNLGLSKALNNKPASTQFNSKKYQ